MAAKKRPAKGGGGGAKKRPAKAPARKRAKAPPAPPPHIVTAWAMAVAAGHIVMGRLVILAAKRHLDDLAKGGARGLYFDPAEADRAFAFFYRFLKHTKGPLAGKPFKLLAWQKFVIGSVFGWFAIVDYDKKLHGTDPDRLRAMVAAGEANAVRRFTDVYEEIARGNGKSTKLAGLLLYALGFLGEFAPECYSAATKRDQARIVFAEARRMARANKLLNKAAFKVGTGQIEDKRTGGEARPLSSDASTQDGLNPFFVAIDELHAHKTRDLFDVLDSAEGKRDWNLKWVITTAGDGANTESICLEQRKLAISVLEGALAEDEFFAFIAAIDDGDDWSDPAVWPKANPCLADMPSLLKTIQKQAARAREHPARQMEFRRKRCNEWLSGNAKWFTPAAWAKGAGDIDLTTPEGREAFLEPLRGRRCFGAIDLSSKRDITAFNLVWPPYDLDDDIDWGQPWFTFGWYFIPEKNIDDRVRRDRVPYNVWRDQGLLIATPGNRVDYRKVRAQVKRASEQFDIEAVAIDPWNAAGLQTDLQRDGFEIVEYRQGLKSYSNPSKEFDALVYGGQMLHGDHPVTKWMALNVDVYIDDNENMRPVKPGKTSVYRVDGVMSMVMATGLATEDRDEPDQTIVLDSDYYENA